VVNRLAPDHVKAKSNQEPKIVNPLDATSQGNDQVKIPVATSKKGGSGVPSKAKSNNEVSKSSLSDKEQKPCKSSGKYSSLRGRSRKCGSLSTRSWKY